MEVFIANEQDEPLDEAKLSRLALHALSSEKVEQGAELSILFVTSDHIHKLNARFAGDDYPTDVLAFPMMEEDDDGLLLGDVVVCPQVARENADKLGRRVSEELETLVLHGTLHLLGYDHQGPKDKAKMDKRVKELLDSFTSVVQ